MQGTPQPRRALDPLPDDPNEFDSPMSPQSPGSGTDTSALTDTGTMRRLAFDAEDPPQVATSVPPPRPVLPVWEPLSAASGRRFSADDAPYESDWAAPRRSAASVSSPLSDYEPLLPPVSRPSAPPPVTVPYQPINRGAATTTQAPGPVPSMAMPTAPEAASASAATSPELKPGSRAARKQLKAAARQAKTDARQAKAAAPAKTEPPHQSKAEVARHSEAERGRHAEATEPRRRSRVVAIIVATVLALALIAAAVLWALQSNNQAVTNPAAKPVDPLLTTAEVAAVGEGPWQEAGVTRTPLCVGQDTEPAAQRSASRMLTSASASVLQLAYTFADDAAATQAYAGRLAAAGSCTQDAALIKGASTIAGLADSADAIRLTIQGTEAENHVLLLTRSGRNVNTFDVVGDAALTAETIANVARPALTRQCSAGGTCPSTVIVSDSLPAAGDPAGWLVAADLPQVTPGSGKWTALPDQAITAHTLQGSQCEDTGLSSITGATSSALRMFVLTGDSKAPAEFGVDHAVWTFSTAKKATSLANKLTTAINGCSTNTPTATVNPGPSAKGIGNAGVKVSGKTWEITHKLPTGTIMFRVAVVTSGTRVSYLRATPTADFDFTDAEWEAIALRAGQRASQAG